MAKIDDYEVVRKLGEGGFGTVYEAKEPGGKRVAVKVLHRNLVSDPTVVKRFFREAMVMARLQHTAIPQVYHFGPHDGTYYLVLEFVEGHEIAQVIGKTPLETGEAVGIMAQLLDALAYAHEHEIVHRDLKPANLILTPEGTLKILDFGIAKIIGGAQLTAPGIVNVTLGYASPEQLRGTAIDGRSDIFSAGVLFHQLLTCKLPHAPKKKDVLEAYKAQIDWACGEKTPISALNPSVPDWADAFYKRCLEESPDKRFPNAGAAREALLAKEAPAVLAPRLDIGAGGPNTGQIEAAAATTVFNPSEAILDNAPTVQMDATDAPTVQMDTAPPAVEQTAQIEVDEEAAPTVAMATPPPKTPGPKPQAPSPEPKAPSPRPKKKENPTGLYIALGVTLFALVFAAVLFGLMVTEPGKNTATDAGVSVDVGVTGSDARPAHRSESR